MDSYMIITYNYLPSYPTRIVVVFWCFFEGHFGTIPKRKCVKCLVNWLLALPDTTFGKPDHSENILRRNHISNNDPLICTLTHYIPIEVDLFLLGWQGYFFLCTDWGEWDGADSIDWTIDVLGNSCLNIEVLRNSCFMWDCFFWYIYIYPTFRYI
jgi:hypothetical protein